MPFPVAKLKAVLSTDPKTWVNPDHRPDDSGRWPGIEKLLSRLIIPVKRVDTNSFVGDFQWDGKMITASRCDNLLHDLAHYQCAHPDRRFKPDFGLGPGPDSFEYTTLASGVTQEESEFEEACASVLGMLWEIHFRLPFEYTVAYHRWDLDTDATPQLNWLKQHKLVVKGKAVLNLRKDI
jgi:hypothetical protein